MKAFWLPLAALCAIATGCNRGGTGENNYGEWGSGASTKTNFVLAPDANGAKKGAVVPGDRGVSAADRELVRRIRTAISANDQITDSGKQFRVVSINGKVTLRGQAASEAEKKMVLSIVKSSGASLIDDQLELRR